MGAGFTVAARATQPRRKDKRRRTENQEGRSLTLSIIHIHMIACCKPRRTGLGGKRMERKSTDPVLGEGNLR